MIGVRNGTLDLHGQYVPVTWTRLAETALPGHTNITLQQPVLSTVSAVSYFTMFKGDLEAW